MGGRLFVWLEREDWQSTLWGDLWRLDGLQPVTVECSCEEDEMDQETKMKGAGR